jgi:hypothetical protein
LWWTLFWSASAFYQPRYIKRRSKTVKYSIPYCNKRFLLPYKVAAREAGWVSLKEINKGLQYRLSVYIPVVFVVRILHRFINVTLLWDLYVHNFHVNSLRTWKIFHMKLTGVMAVFSCYKFQVQKH